MVASVADPVEGAPEHPEDSDSSVDFQGVDPFGGIND